MPCSGECQLSQKGFFGVGDKARQSTNGQAKNVLSGRTNNNAPFPEGRGHVRRLMKPAATRSETLPQPFLNLLKLLLQALGQPVAEGLEVVLDVRDLDPSFISSLLRAALQFPESGGRTNRAPYRASRRSPRSRYRSLGRACPWPAVS